MATLPVVSGDRFVAAMRLIGYEVDRIRGSHVFLWCEGRRTLSVPRHRELKRGTLRALIRDAGLTVEEFVELLDRT